MKVACDWSDHGDCCLVEISGVGLSSLLMHFINATCVIWRGFLSVSSFTEVHYVIFHGRKCRIEWLLFGLLLVTLTQKLVLNRSFQIRDWYLGKLCPLIFLPFNLQPLTGDCGAIGRADIYKPFGLWTTFTTFPWTRHWTLEPLAPKIISPVTKCMCPSNVQYI